MKPKFLKSISLFLCIGLTQWACQTNKETQVSPTVNVLITIEEARTWYQSRSSANARTAGKKEGELAYWKYAQASQLTNGTDVIVVPLLYNANVPVSVPSDENFVKQGDKFYLSGFDRNAYQIQQKLLISKDEQGNLRSVVITVIPDRKDQRKKEHVKKDKFSGVVLLMNESGDDFEIGWRYKNGKGVDIFYPRAKSANGRLATYSCKVGFYQKMAQSNSGGYNCSQNSSVCLPSAYVDLDGGFWVLIAEFEATCDDGVPNGAPTRQNPWDTNSSWVVADPNRGGAGGGPILSDPFNPSSGQTPVDYGMPNDLDPADAFAWEMANRIGPDIYLTGEEIELIRNNWDLTYYIRNYVQATNTKPILTTEPNNEALDLISLYGGLEAYAGPDPNVCNECTEASPTPGLRFHAPRSAFPNGPLGDFLYKIDRALAESSLFPGIGALRAPTTVFTRYTFRRSLQALRPKPDGLYDAHHILPQEFVDWFGSKGINIHEPRFGSWWANGAHQFNAASYNQAWRQFILNHPNATHEEIAAFAKQLMSQYGFDIFWF